MNTISKIGILTGGGDAPGLNAVIRAVTKTAILDYGWKVIGIRDGFQGLIEPERTILLTLKSVRGLLPSGGTILGTTNRGNPFHYPEENGDEIRYVDRSGTVLDRLNELGIDVLVVIGGDGSLAIARDFIRKGVKIVGVPKTIDNDILATDLTFGYSTAITTATEAIDKLHTTAESHHRVMVLEVMGREAGWIALESGISGGADVILIPEIPFDYDAICGKISGRREKEIMFSIVVVSEGAFPRGGKPSYQQIPAGKKEVVKRLGGVGERVGAEISRRLNVETRVTVLGHLQRGGGPIPFDRFLATRFGKAAVQLIAENKMGQMVCLHGRKVESISIEKAAGANKLVDPDGQVVKMAESLGICLGR